MIQTDLLRIPGMIAAWGSLAFVAFTTMSPIELRPMVAAPDTERFAAFALIGLAFGLAYPRRIVLVALAIALAASGLEAGQHLMPGRHGYLSDLMVKLIGGTVGIAGAAIVNMLFQTRQTVR